MAWIGLEFPIRLRANYDPRRDPMFLPSKMAYYNHMYAIIDKILAVLKDFCVENNYKLLFALMAVYKEELSSTIDSDDVDYSLPTRRLVKLLKKNGIDYVDVTPSLLKEHTSDGPILASDGHTNAKGHRIISEVLQCELEKRKWI